MKQITIIFLLLGTLTAFGQTTTKTITDSEQVTENDIFLNGLYLKHKAAKALNFYADNFILTTATGETKDKRKVISEMASPAIRYDVYETLERKVMIEATTATLSGVLHQKGARDGESFDIKLQLICTWTKVGTTWKLLSSTETAISK